MLCVICTVSVPYCTYMCYVHDMCLCMLYAWCVFISTIYIYIYIYVCVFVCVCVLYVWHVFVCICVYIVWDFGDKERLMRRGVLMVVNLGGRLERSRGVTRNSNERSVSIWEVGSKWHREIKLKVARSLWGSPGTFMVTLIMKRVGNQREWGSVRDHFKTKYKPHGW